MMKFFTKYLCFSIFLCLGGEIKAQNPNPPTGLTASTTFSDRIVLVWHYDKTNHKFRILRKHPGKAAVAIDTITQQSYIDRDSTLQRGVKYEYQIFAIAPNGLVSEGGNKALGSKIVVAAGEPTPLTLDSPNCVTITPTDWKISKQRFSLVFLASSKCRVTDTVQLSLYRSDDALLSENDNLLNQQVFDLSLSGGSLYAKNDGEPTEGYLILKVEVGEQRFTLTHKIK